MSRRRRATVPVPVPLRRLFEITLEELWDGDDIAHCPSCTLLVRVIFDKEQLPPRVASPSS